jgi:hypothetical protein
MKRRQTLTSPALAPPAGLIASPWWPRLSGVVVAGLAVTLLCRLAVQAGKADDDVLGESGLDLEERLGSLAAALDLEAPQISATPTLVELSFGPLSQQHSYTLRVRPKGVDLDALIGKRFRVGEVLRIPALAQIGWAAA